jgi:hypothetical protein
MRDFLKRFLNEDGGAVTVDWVVLTAAMASFGIGVAFIITSAATDPADGVGAYLAAIEVNP